MPTLQQEAALGFDLAIEARWILLCLQFKISTKLVRRNAGQAAHFGVPYFRFPVKTDQTSNGQCQHNTLCDLERSLSGVGEHVRYAAPIFDTHDELTTLARAGALAEQSVFIPPMRLGPVTPGDTHHFAYSTRRNVRPFSKPGAEIDASFEGLINQLRSTSTEQRTLERFLVSCDLLLGEATNRQGLRDLAPGRAAAIDAVALDVQPLLIGVLDPILGSRSAN